MLLDNSLYKWIVGKQDVNSQIILDFEAGKGEFANRVKGNSIFSVEVDTTIHKFINHPTEDNINNFNKKFTLIYSSNVLEHIRDNMHVINSFYDNLSTGGVVEILVPARMEIYSNMDKNVGHYRRYNKRDLMGKFTSAGFEVNYCRYFDFFGYCAAFLYKITGASGSIPISSLKFYGAYIFPVSKFLDIFTFGMVAGKNIVLSAVKR